MNVLLITFSFPPAGGVGVLRAVSLAKYLPDEGVHVDVLTAKNAPAVGRDDALLRSVPSSVRVHHTWTLDLPFGVRKAIKRFVSGRSVAAQSDSKSAAGATKRKGGGLKEILGNLLLPDPQIGWLPFALPAAKRIIRQRKIDLVLVTVPPFSTVKLVKALRKTFPTLPIILDFRDEWLGTTIKLVSFNSNMRAQAVAQTCEREGVQSATSVVAVTRAAQEELIRRYPDEEPAKFEYIPNGFDSLPHVEQTKVVAPKTSDRPLLLTYIGTVYGSTDPSTFVEAVLMLPPEARNRLKVRFIGHIESEAYRASLMRLGDSVDLVGFMPQAKALAAVADTNYLLLITHDRINVAAKFYDYLAGGKPIIAAVHPSGDVRRLMEETGAGRWADVNNVSEIHDLLLDLTEPNGLSLESDSAKNRFPERKPERIAGYHRRVITARYAALIKSLVAQDKGTS